MVQQCPGYECDQSNRETIADHRQKYSARRIANRFLQPQFESTLEQNEDQRQHSEDTNHDAEVARINPMQDRAKSHADEQQHDDVGNARPA